MVGDYGEEDTKGIIPKAFSHIFGYIDSIEDDTKFLVRCSYLEIYNETILDLLGSDHTTKHDVKEDPDKGIYVNNLTNVIVKSVPEIEKIMNAGNKHRKTGKTAMNDTSSRSHSIFTIYIETSRMLNGEQKIKAGKLNLVDLAGSERQSKTNAEGDRLKEAQKINLSLSALGNVISALVDGKSNHIPYRDSKLTRLLQDSLGGNTKTVMIAAVSPAAYNYDETLSTLRYASRAKMIKNKPRINEDPKDALLREYEDEIKQLRAALAELQKGGGGGAGNAMLIKQMTESFKNSEMKNGHSVDDIINRLDSGQNNISPSKMSQKMKELEKLAEHNKKMQSAINEKEEKIEQERLQREQLEQMLKEMEAKMVHGGEGVQEEEKERIEAKAFREYQLKLKKQKRKEKKLLEDQKRKDEDLLLMEHEYNDLQEEVNDKTKLLNKLRKRYKGALAEIQDLDSEHYNEKAELLDTIRTMEVDLGFYKAIVDTLMSESNLYKIKSKSSYDDERKEWEIPPFVLKGQQVNLPKLGLQKAKRFIEEEKSSHVVEFKQKSISDNSDDYGQGKTSKSMFNVRPKKKSKQGDRHKSQGPNKGLPLKHESQSAPFGDEDDDVLNGINEEDEFDQFRNPNGLHDYKERYQEFENTPQDKPITKLRKQQFLSQQPQKYDYNGYGNGIQSESKLPPSLRWALDEEQSQIDESPLSYQRNAKIGAHLVPLRANMPGVNNSLHKNGSSHIIPSTKTIYGSNEDVIDKIPSIKKLSSQKTRRLQPLRK